MEEQVIITSDMNWIDIADQLCDNSEQANELVMAAQHVRDGYYAMENSRLLNRHDEEESN